MGVRPSFAKSFAAGLSMNSVWSQDHMHAESYRKMILAPYAEANRTIVLAIDR
jgi:hypothetical protein